MVLLSLLSSSPLQTPLFPPLWQVPSQKAASNGGTPAGSLLSLYKRRQQDSSPSPSSLALIDSSMSQWLLEHQQSQ